MAFVNFSVLAAGSLLMGLPILLHLLMKQRPRHQVFPALRFLHRRHVANKRQLRLRNWLLLALRIGAIGLLAAALARPSVDSAGLGHWVKAMLLSIIAALALVAFFYTRLEKKGPVLQILLAGAFLLTCGGFVLQSYRALGAGVNSSIGDAQSPVAAVLVFDTSPRMGLRHENLTRLEEARRVARDLMKQLPSDSEVAVVDASTAATPFSVDIGIAVNMIDSLQVMGREFALHELVLRGIELARQRNDKRKEVYVLTDLSQQAWRGPDYKRVADLLASNPDLSLFVLDVGVAEPRNLQLGTLRLSADAFPRGRPFQIQTEVTSLGITGEFTAEVFVEQPDPTRPVIVDGKVLLPESTQRDRSRLNITDGGTVPIAFELLGLPTGIHHGRVSISSSDGLAIDDVRYFTVQVHEPWTVLLAASEGAVSRYVEFALSPLALRQQQQAAFACQAIEATQLAEQELAKYSVVALLDPLPLATSHWELLSTYVEQGGALALFLGRNASPQGAAVEGFNQKAAAVLPGRLELQWRTAKDDFLFVAPRNWAHPILSSFRGRETLIPWDQAPVFRHWSFGELHPAAAVVTRFSNDQPALLESVLGAGRIITMTTPVSDPPNNPDRPAWNHLPTSEDPLAFFMLVNEIFLYLASQGERGWNYDVGQVANVPVTDGDETTWQLFTPAGDWQNVAKARAGGVVAITATDAPGTYRLKSNGLNAESLGFSVNLPQEATDVQRVEADDLDDVLGPGQYTLARGPEELDRGIGQSRVGRELYPFLMLLIVGVLSMEHLISNRFYPPNAQAGRTAARGRRAA